MGIFSRLFSKNAPSKTIKDHAVIIEFNYGSIDLASLFVLEGELEQAIAEAGVGEFDGNEMAPAAVTARFTCMDRTTTGSSRSFGLSSNRAPR